MEVLLYYLPFISFQRLERNVSAEGLPLAQPPASKQQISFQDHVWSSSPSFPHESPCCFYKSSAFYIRLCFKDLSEILTGNGYAAFSKGKELSFNISSMFLSFSVLLSACFPVSVCPSIFPPLFMTFFPKRPHATGWQSFVCWGTWTLTVGSRCHL